MATPGEGVELRTAGIGRPIVVFTPLFPHGQEACLAGDLTPVIGDPDALGVLAASGRPSTPRSTPAWAAPAFAGTTRRPSSALRAALRDRAACGDRVHRTSSAETDPAACERPVAAVPRRGRVAARAARPSCTGRTARPPCSARPMPVISSGRASSSTAAPRAHRRCPRPWRHCARWWWLCAASRRAIP
ncbi:MAG: hypothetical protein MZU79_00560 [Anaerotruncus sp.]|nr:hypothetical protein [Anaerotruncus sp.]